MRLHTSCVGYTGKGEAVRSILERCYLVAGIDGATERFCLSCTAYVKYVKVFGYGKGGLKKEHILRYQLNVGSC